MRKNYFSATPTFQRQKNSTVYGGGKQIFGSSGMLMGQHPEKLQV